jgi:hypothetical protein
LRPQHRLIKQNYARYKKILQGDYYMYQEIGVDNKGGMVDDFLKVIFFWGFLQNKSYTFQVRTFNYVGVTTKKH